MYRECLAGAQINFPESGHGLGHVTPTICGSTVGYPVGYPSDSLASCIFGYVCSTNLIHRHLSRRRVKLPLSSTCVAVDFAASIPVRVDWCSCCLRCHIRVVWSSLTSINYTAFIATIEDGFSVLIELLARLHNVLQRCIVATATAARAFGSSRYIHSTR